MLIKHHAVKLDWKVPEPIKAGGETLRGVLVISAKELSEIVVGKIKKNMGKGKHGEDNGQSDTRRQKKKHDRTVRITHIEIDLTGVEEVTTGAGILSRTRTDHHCFLHKTQVLSIEELKWIHDPSSCASATASPVTAATPIVQSANTLSARSNTTTSGNTLNLPSPTTSVVPESFQPGCIAPGTQQGIAFQMRVPEKVGGTFKNAHASISYQLTANVHIRLGKEAFVLQHPLSLSLFELVQICAATKIASPHDVSPYLAPVPPAPEFLATSDGLPVRSSICSTTSSSSGGRQPSSVRFVIPKANSVLGTAAVKPYSLWGLGPATSSQRHHYTYSNSHGYGRYRHSQSHQSHQRQASFTTTVATAAGSTSSSAMADPVPGMTRSYSATSALSPQKNFFHEESSAVGHQHHRMERSQENNVMISAEDQYRQQQKQQQQQQQQSQPQSSRNRHAPRNTESMDGLDEVGFGAHIDKSVAAAGDNVTLDMFVVKSDLMKVVDIKVSLVETIQVFSLMDVEDACSVISPMTSRARVLVVDDKEEEEQHKGQQTSKSKSDSRRRLVDTHVVKIAKDYVPAQSEESHANDNHLKGYYEDYEDFRTAKSLSMYKLGMRIPETALTIMDRELLKVEYMFVIKFFFKGRMGAFLELPIEIISQYNHNRISTISGAISCVSNSVQIALPPVPILVKRSEVIQSDLDDVPVEDSNAFISPNTADKNADFGPYAETEAVADAADGGAEVDQEKESDKFQDFIIKNCEDAITAAEAASTERKVAPVDQINMLSNPIPSKIEGLAASVKAAPVKDSTQEKAFTPKIGAHSSSLKVFERKPSASEAPSHEHVKRALSMNTGKRTPTTAQMTHSPVQGDEEQAIVSSSRLSKAESEACKSNVARITAALMGKELAATNCGNGFADLKKKSSTESTSVVPKIVINNVHASRCTNINSSSSLSSSRRSSQDKDFSQPGSLVSNSTKSTPSLGSNTTSPSSNTTKVASPALPLLFDLTSAALPSTPPAHVPSPIVIPSPSKSSGSGSGSRSNAFKSNKVTVGSGNITTRPIVGSPSPITEGLSSSRRFKDIDTPQQQQKLLHARQNTSLSTHSAGSGNSSSAINSDSRSDDDSSHGSGDSKSSPNNNRLVAKIAKSLSSPLLRSRAGAGSAIAGGGGSSASPNGSITNLQSVSPQQQSTAFTLAATTLSALTLLSSVGQAAVNNEGNSNSNSLGHTNNTYGSSNSSGVQHQLHARRPSQPSPLSQRPLKSCLKKRRGSAPPIVVTTSSLSSGDHLTSNVISALKAPQSSGGRKKVTFAKGFTPLPSPTASQVFFPETEYGSKMSQQQQHLSSYVSSYSSSVSELAFKGSLTATGVSAAFNRAAATASASPPSTGSSGSQSVSAEDRSPVSTQNSHDNAQDPSNGPMRIKSPTSASPRARMHHPFDGHPSRLSPLEKRHLDFQIKVQVPLRGNCPEQERVQEQQQSVAEIREDADVEEEDEVEEDDEDMEYEEEDETDEDDDERETEEERIERRRQARVAWLAKYGDAFKQVYGAVPELPPI
ncbi:hypothetical protein BGZ58_006756 [Dissophora ornata]|nr:hypothetical protein BGZ58_006756 [Dissophora ornata]